MTSKEAIEILKRLQDPEPWEPTLNSAAYGALNMAISALEKQVGKRPLPHVEMFECENCGNVIMPYDDYCYRCGQRIDWINEHGTD